MRKEAICLFAVVLCAGGESHAEVVGIFWEKEELPPMSLYTIWNLYAAVDTAQTFVSTADLGDLGVGSTGLFSTMGFSIIYSGDPFCSTSLDSCLTIGSVDPTFARDFTVTPSGTGGVADAAWFVTVDVFPILLSNDFSSYATQLGHFVVDPGAPLDVLGGPMGGPNGDIQSRIFVGWTDATGVGFGLFDIPITPAPASFAVLVLGGMSQSRRRRRQ